MNAHIINCDKDTFFNNFLPNGYIGVGLVLTGLTPNKLSNACRASYSMYADMKTIRAGDIIFVHAGHFIYGAFKAESEFKEKKLQNSLFLSENIHYYPDKKSDKPGWKNNIKNIPNLGYYRIVAISPYISNTDENLCFEKGIASTDIFELKNRGKIQFIPERWKYADASRTVRPIMFFEAIEIIKLLHLENADEKKRRIFKGYDTSKLLDIKFILNPDIIENEKIIEGWILENIARNTDLDNAIGPLTCYGNNMPIGYLKFIDIFGYQLLFNDYKKFKLIEVKKDCCIFPDHINQLLDYINLVVENITKGDYKAVEGILVTNKFDSNTINSAKHFNSLGKKLKLVEFDYNVTGYNKLLIKRIV